MSLTKRIAPAVGLLFSLLLITIACGTESRLETSKRSQRSSFEWQGRQWLEISSDSRIENEASPEIISGEFIAVDSFSQINSDINLSVGFESLSADSFLEIVLFSNVELKKGFVIRVQGENEAQRILLAGKNSKEFIEISDFFSRSEGQQNLSIDLHHSHSHLIIWDLDARPQLRFDSALDFGPEQVWPGNGQGLYWGIRFHQVKIHQLQLGPTRMQHP
jgi:hypothetical protein